MRFVAGRQIGKSSCAVVLTSYNESDYLAHEIFHCTK